VGGDETSDRGVREDRFRRTQFVQAWVASALGTFVGGITLAIVLGYVAYLARKPDTNDDTFELILERTSSMWALVLIVTLSLLFTLVLNRSDLPRLPAAIRDLVRPFFRTILLVCLTLLALLTVFWVATLFAGWIRFIHTE
jgi:hypothetical protein